MSVVMTLRVEGDGAAAEKLAEENPSIFMNIIAKAKEQLTFRTSAG